MSAFPQVQARYDSERLSSAALQSFFNLSARWGLTAAQERILLGSLETMRSASRLGFIGYDVADAKAHHLLGNERAALSALQLAYDEGYRAGWWLELEANRCLADLHQQSEYSAIVERIRQDMREQRLALESTPP